MNFGSVGPVARRAASRPRGNPASVSCFLSTVGRRHVAVDRVVERRNVGRALDRGVAAQRHDAAARPADVAEQKLQQRAGADDLDAVGVLRPGDGVGERRRPVRAGVGQDRLGDLEKRFLAGSR